MEPGDGWPRMLAAPIESADPAMAGLLVAERKGQTATVNLIASESYCPQPMFAEEHPIPCGLVGAGTCSASGGASNVD